MVARPRVFHATCKSWKETSRMLSLLNGFPVHEQTRVSHAHTHPYPAGQKQAKSSVHITGKVLAMRAGKLPCVGGRCRGSRRPFCLSRSLRWSPRSSNDIQTCPMWSNSRSSCSHKHIARSRSGKVLATILRQAPATIHYPYRSHMPSTRR